MVSDSLKRLIQNIREQISMGETQAALDQLQNYIGDSSSTLKNELSLHAARYNRLRHDDRKGVISRETAQIEYTRLENAILDLLAEIPKHISSAMLPAPTLVDMANEVHLLSDFKPEKIIGINNLKQLSWLQRGLDVSKSVCRILTPNGLGTGFLISVNKLISNHHVIPTPEVASQSFAEFNYQQDSSGGYLPTFRYRLSPAIFHSSPPN